ncbi:MAG: LD-carboxypeptidase [Eubacteriales bacterium]|nr:LD-carboxypeptidase [Eubacteriales bacterium]
MKIIKPEKLNAGDTVGLLAPAYAIGPEHLQNALSALSRFGYGTKLSRNIFSDAHGYAGSVSQRADDFNEMIADSGVKMLLFGSGEVCNEILPYIDYDAVRRNPKIICSYSDGTTLLNAIFHKTGLITFCGASTSTFDNLTDYNRRSFEARLTAMGTEYEQGSEWHTIRSGSAAGILVGGYLVNFAALCRGDYFGFDGDKKYILFLEDHEKFSSPAAVSKWLSHIEQCGVFRHVTGLIFGHYSQSEQPLIDDILRRLGERNGIALVRCDDFGHGANNAILPVGINAALDARVCRLELCESGVCSAVPRTV